MTDPNSFSGLQRGVFFALFALAALRVLFLFIPAPALWGINYFHYLPLGISLLLIGVSIGVPFLLRTKARDRHKAKKRRKTKEQLKLKASHSTRVSDAAMRTPRLIHSPLFLFFGVIVGLALFLHFSIAWPLLGDGTLFLGYLYKFNITGHYVFIGTEPGAMFLIQFIFAIGKEFGMKLDMQSPFHIMDAASGTLFIVFAILFARKQEGIAWTALLLLLSCGGLLYFFGYVETYAPEYAVSLVFFYFVYRYLKGEAKFMAVCIALLLACIFHLQNLILFPAAALAYYQRQAQIIDYRRIYIGLSTCIPILFAAYLVLVNVAAFRDTFIPLHASPDDHYTLLAPQHLLDILNEHLLLVSVPCMILIVALTRFRGAFWQTPYVLFLVSALLFEEAFLIGGNTFFGLARDWDIFGTLGLVLTLLSIEWLRQNADAIGIPAWRAIGLSAVAGAVAWVILNVQAASVFRRCEDILAQYRNVIGAEDTHYGYENIRKYYLLTNLDSELSTIRKMEEVLPWALDVNIALSEARKAGDRLDERGREQLERIVYHIHDIGSDSVIREEGYGKNHLRIGPPRSADNITLGDQYIHGVAYLWANLHRLSLESAVAEADFFIGHHPALPYGYEIKGFLLMQEPRQEKAVINLLYKAISCDTERPKPHLLLAQIEHRLDSNANSRFHYRRALMLDSTFLNGLGSFSLFLQASPPQPSDSSDVAFLRRNLARIHQMPAQDPNSIPNESRPSSEQAATLLRGLERWWSSRK